MGAAGCVDTDCNPYHRYWFRTFGLRRLFNRAQLDRNELNRIWVLRKVFSPLSTVESMELLVEKLEKKTTNAEFLNSMSSM